MRMILVLLTLFLSACATAPMSLSESTQVPSDRVFYPTPTVTEHSAKVIIIRDSGYFLGGTPQNVYINGTPAAAVETGERLELVLNPGEYTFTVQPTDYSAINASNSTHQSLLADKIYYFRIFTEDSQTGRPLSYIQRYLP